MSRKTEQDRPTSLDTKKFQSQLSQLLLKKIESPVLFAFSHYKKCFTTPSLSKNINQKG